MFDIQSTLEELGIERDEINEIKHSPRANGAKGANLAQEVSTISTHPTPENTISSTHEQAESLVNSIDLHDDRVFVRRCLIGIYGAKRLEIMNGYIEQWRLGVEAEPVVFKQENAGRYRANIWMREKKFN